MEASQHTPCGWKGCLQQFEDDVDMNLHMLSKHMVLLDYGNFQMTKRAPGRKRTHVETNPERSAVSEAQIPRNLEVSEPIPPKRANIQEVIDKQTNHQPPERFYPANPAPSGLNPSFVHLQAPKQPPIVEPPVVMAPRAPVAYPHHVVEQKARALFNRFPSPATYHDLESKPPLIHNGVNPFSPNHAQSSSAVGQKQNNGPSTAEDRNQNNQTDTQVAAEQQARLDQSEVFGEDEEVEYRSNTPPPSVRKLSEVVDEFLMRVNQIKRLGFIRQNRSIYCIVCLKYVKSRQDCNWQHNEQEERIAELYSRRYGKGAMAKNQLITDLTDLKVWLAHEENDPQGTHDHEKRYLS